jgi:hypothetical protein
MTKHTAQDTEACPAGRVPGELLDLFARIKNLECADGSWPGADVVDALVEWLVGLGIDPDAPYGAVAVAVHTAPRPAKLVSTRARRGQCRRR